MILFQNPGEISPLSFQVMGLNAKPGSTNPFGFFGTGLKMAISVLVRNGHRIEIQSGPSTYTFEKEAISFRGKAFDQIMVSFSADSGAVAIKTPLPFTTELAKTWLPWMAYRELWCNCSDEQGTTDRLADDAVVEPTEGFTSILVWGLDEIHEIRGDFILLTKPLYKCDAFEIHPGQGKKVYYRGICVGELDKPTVFRYNFLNTMSLSEDRQLSAPYMVPYYLQRWFAEEVTDQDLIERAILAPRGTLEHDTFDYEQKTPTADFLAIAERHVHNLRTNSSARSLYKFSTKKTIEPKNKGLTAVRKAMLEKAIAFCHSLDFPVSEYEIIWTDSLGAGIMGLAEDNRIYLSDIPFDQGTKRLASTLIEEFIHLRYNLRDESRELQDFLLDRLVSLGEDNRGEPL